MLGSHVLYLRGMRILMFQLSGFYYRLLPDVKGLVDAEPESSHPSPS